MRFWIACCVALAISVPAHGSLTGVSRDTRLNVSATADTVAVSDSRHETTFADFDDTISRGAAAIGGTATATASQRSSVGGGSGGFSASGGAASAFSGTGTASSSSLFTYQFLANANMDYRFGGGISRTGSGDVSAVLRDLSWPQAPEMLRREVNPANADFNETWILDFGLLQGHTYELSLEALSGPAQGSTSYTINFTPIPEPAVMASLIPILMLLKRRG